MKNQTRFRAAGLAAALLWAGCAVDEGAEDTRPEIEARVYASDRAQPLTGPSKEVARAVVQRFLEARGAAEVGDLLRVVSERVTDRGITHVRMEQEVGGLRVAGAYVKAAVNGRGELLHVIDNLTDPAGADVAAARIDEGRALAAAMREQGLDAAVPAAASRDRNVLSFERGEAFYDPPTVERVAFVGAGGALETGFLVETWTARENLLLHTLVDGEGQVVSVESLTANDRYNVFRLDPSKGAQAIVEGPGSGNAQSPQGWLAGTQTTNSIRGNNVNAYLDRDRNNAPDPGGTAVTNGDFLTVANLSQQPTVVANRAVAVQNLFYLNNLIHDELYSHGFVEAAGNFQVNNFGRGGASNDPVAAEAQDGGGTNNANFATPADGRSGRMQMFLWNTGGGSVMRDGDVDADVVFHEYGHGLSQRMIGGMSGRLAGAIGEGNSDVLAITMNGDDVVGEYSTGDPTGVRSRPYTDYPRTYGDIAGTGVHFDGEVYGAIGWRLNEIFAREGLTRSLLLDYLIDGMNFTPRTPAFEDMRDGILQAAENRGLGHECLIWEAFADFGVGVGADGAVVGSGVRITESFSLPATCQ